MPYGASAPAIDIVVRYDTGQINATLDGEPVQINSFASGGSMPSWARDRLFGAGPGPRVYCLPAGNDGGPPREFFNLPEGNYVLSELPPGDYRILTFDEPQEFEYHNPDAMRAYDSMGQVVHLTAGQKLQLQLKPIRSQ